MVVTALRAATAPVATLTVIAVLLSGCASVLTGTALRDPRVDPRAVNAAMLDPGSFSTKPAAPLGVAGNERAGRTAEAHRMSEAVLLPFEIGPTLTEREPTSMPFTDAAQLGVAFIASFPGPGPHDMIAGSKSGARAPRSTTKLVNAVLRFASPEEAAGAADYMATHTVRDPVDLGNGTTLPARQPVLLPDRPETKAVRADDDGWSDVFAFTTYGTYVLVQAATADTGDAAIALALAAIDKQRPALDRFVPTPVDQLANLPVDPTGLLARTLAPPTSETSPAMGVYGPHGALNFMASPQRSQQLFAAAGLQAAAFEAAHVYQSRDAAGAARIADDFIAEVAEDKYTRTGPILGLPAARCLQSPKEKYPVHPQTYYCVLATDRYVIEAVSPDETDAHQRVTAQYLMLTAS